jgi:hypothetical protein
MKAAAQDQGQLRLEVGQFLEPGGGILRIGLAGHAQRQALQAALLDLSSARTYFIHL